MRRRAAGGGVAALVFYLLACAAAAGLGAAVTLPQIDRWYAALAKPSWTPPNFVFGPAWTALYIMIALAAWLVSRSRSPVRRAALASFWIQLLLNALWSPLFFSLHRLGVAALDIVLLLMASAVMVGRFWRSAPLAGLLTIPYLFWIAYATSLSVTIWRLNPG